MQAGLALVAIVVGQLGFWALLRAGAFVGALAGSAIFWSVALTSWTVAARRWWRASATPEVALALILILITAASFFVSQGLSDDAYCGGVAPEYRRGCWMSPASQDAFFWTGIIDGPVALIAAALATMRARAVGAATELTDEGIGTTPIPGPVTALVVAAVILAVTLVVLVLLIVANAGG